MYDIPYLSKGKYFADKNGQYHYKHRVYEISMLVLTKVKNLTWKNHFNRISTSKDNTLDLFLFQNYNPT